MSKKHYWSNHYLDDLNCTIRMRNTNNGSVSITASGEKILLKNPLYSHGNQKRNAKNQLSMLDELIDEIYIDHDKHTQNQEIAKKSHMKNVGNATIVLDGKYIKLKSTDFSKISKWDYDNFDHALESFLLSCVKFTTYVKQKKNIQNYDFTFGEINDWLNVCNVATAYSEINDAKSFFETQFTPFAVFDKKTKQDKQYGTFTGYCELSVEGSRKRTNKFRYGIYKMPPECKSKPCYTRDQINRGAIDGRKLELYWLSDYLDLMNLQTQGSGIVDLNNNKSYARVGFGGTNKQPYIRFWNYFRRYNILPSNKSSNVFAIRDWIAKNPREAMKAFGYNPSYTFFVHLENSDTSAPGAHGVPLTPSRSIAVDPSFIPYGVPMWIATNVAIQDRQHGKWMQLHRLTIAQDTGDAIKGPVRADVFFGHGSKACFLAHRMRFDGKYYMLLPKSVIKKTIKNAH